MAAPHGNQYAKGCQTSGRPREHDRENIAKEMIEWAKLPDSINLCGFCCSREPPLNPRKITDWAKECNEFRGAYETAKAFLGNRREYMLNADLLHVKAYDLNAKTYDQFLKEEVRQQAEFEASLAAQETKQWTEDQEQKLKAFTDQVERGVEALKSSRINNNKEI